MTFLRLSCPPTRVRKASTSQRRSLRKGPNPSQACLQCKLRTSVGSSIVFLCMTLHPLDTGCWGRSRTSGMGCRRCATAMVKPWPWRHLEHKMNKCLLSPSPFHTAIGNMYAAGLYSVTRLQGTTVFDATSGSGATGHTPTTQQPSKTLRQQPVPVGGKW